MSRRHPLAFFRLLLSRPRFEWLSPAKKSLVSLYLCSQLSLSPYVSNLQIYPSPVPHALSGFCTSTLLLFLSPSLSLPMPSFFFLLPMTLAPFNPLLSHFHLHSMPNSLSTSLLPPLSHRYPFLFASS